MPYTAFRWRDYADLNSGAAISFSGSLSQCAGYLKTWLQRSYSELTKTSTALSRLAILSVLSVARRLVLIFVNPLYN